MPPHCNRVPRVCAYCGASLSVLPSRTNHGRPIYCSTACQRLGQQARAAAEAPARFWARVEKTEGCWLWHGPVNPYSGYGWFTLFGKHVSAHRYSWQLEHGPIPEGLNVCHNCDVNYPVRDWTNRRCVRPDHLFLGTQADNLLDMRTKQRGYPPPHLAGVANARSKLSEADVIAIRERYSPGAITYAMLAEEYGVSIAAIRFVARGLTWQHGSVLVPILGPTGRLISRS